MKTNSLAATGEGRAGWRITRPHSQRMITICPVWQVQKAPFLEFVFASLNAKFILCKVCCHWSIYKNNRLKLFKIVVTWGDVQIGLIKWLNKTPAKKKKEWQIREWHTHRGLCKAENHSKKSRKTHTCKEMYAHSGLCVCPQKTWKGLNLSLLPEFEALPKQGENSKAAL